MQKFTSGKRTLSNNNCLKLNGSTGSIKRLNMHATKNGIKRLKKIILLHFPNEINISKKFILKDMKLLFTSCIVKSEAKYCKHHHDYFLHEYCQIDGKQKQTPSVNLTFSLQILKTFLALCQNGKTLGPIKAIMRRFPTNNLQTFNRHCK